MCMLCVCVWRRRGTTHLSNTRGSCRRFRIGNKCRSTRRFHCRCHWVPTRRCRRDYWSTVCVCARARVCDSPYHLLWPPRRYWSHSQEEGGSYIFEPRPLATRKGLSALQLSFRPRLVDRCLQKWQHSAALTECGLWCDVVCCPPPPTIHANLHAVWCVCACARACVCVVCVCACVRAYVCVCGYVPFFALMR